MFCSDCASLKTDQGGSWLQTHYLLDELEVNSRKDEGNRCRMCESLRDSLHALLGRNVHQVYEYLLIDETNDGPDVRRGCLLPRDSHKEVARRIMLEFSADGE